MDQNQIGPNMDTTRVQRYVRDGRYPRGKTVPYNRKVLASNPTGVNLQDYRQDEGHHGNFFWFFWFFLFLTFSSLFGIPENARFSAHLWASQKAGFRHPILILSLLVM